MSAATGAQGKGGTGHDAFWSLVYLVSIRFGTFGLSVISARLLGPWGIGAFGIAVQLAALAGLVGGMNLAAAAGRQLPAAPSPAHRIAIVRTSGTAVAIGSAIVGSLLAWFGPTLATSVYGDARLGPVLVAAGLFSAATSLYVWGEGTLQGLRWFRWQARWGTVVAVADIVAGTLGAFRDLTVMLVARAGVRLAAMGWLVGSVLRALRREGAGEPGPAGTGAAGWPVVLGGLFGFAGPSLLANVLVVGGLAWMRAALTQGAGVDEAGFYQAADSVVQGLVLVPLAAAMAFIPSVSRAGTQGYPNFDASLGRALRRVTGFNLPLCLLVAGLSPWLPGLVFGHALLPASRALAILAGASGLAGMGTMMGAALLGRGEVWAGVAVNAAWALVLFALLHAGLAGAGAFGATVAVGGAYLVLDLIFLGIALRQWRVSARVVSAPLAVNLGAWLVVLACTVLLPGSPWILAGACVAMALMVFMGWAKPELHPERFASMFSPGASTED